jgi:PAS domain S-box-containing protein
VASREVVSGEPVVVTSVRHHNGAERVVWIQGWPLERGTGDDSLASTGVVLLSDVSPLIGAPVPASLTDRAVLATERCLTISDPNLDDNPLIYVNPAFERVTGYAGADILGRNCRILQGPGTDQAEVIRLRKAIAASESCTTVLLNYRADGTAFWNEVSVSPILDRAGAVTHFVGVQNDVTARVAAEREREAAFATERETRALLESVLTTAPVGLGFWDLDLRYTRVNEALAEINGRSVEEHLGRHVLEVLGDDLREVVGLIQSVIHTGEPVLDHAIQGTTDARPGQVRHWVTSYYPVRDTNDTLVSVGAVVIEVTAQRRAEADRAEALERERHARLAAEAAQTRMALLAQSMEALTAGLDLKTGLARFADLLVPDPADWVAVHLVEDDGTVVRAVLRHTDPTRVERLVAGEAGTDEVPEPVAEVLGTGRPVLLSEIPDNLLTAHTTEPDNTDVIRDLGLHSAIVVPLPARGRTIGALTFARSEAAPPFGSDDLSLALELATRAALAVDNKRLYERDHRVAITLQQSLLPDRLPDVDGFEMCVRYVAGAVGVDVGGDWYDAFPLNDGTIALTIGDVVGHDLAAAVKMGELRTTLRAYAADGAPPADVVNRLDHLAYQQGAGFVATLIYGVLDPTTGRFTYTRAGHLPPILIDLDRQPVIVDDIASPPLGMGWQHVQQELTLEPGSTLVLYTDGLVERRDEEIDRGLQRLAEAAAHPTENTESLCDLLLDELSDPGGLTDDIALLIVRRHADAMVDMSDPVTTAEGQPTVGLIR